MKTPSIINEDMRISGYARFFRSFTMRFALWNRWWLVSKRQKLSGFMPSGFVQASQLLLLAANSPTSRRMASRNLMMTLVV